MLRRKKREGLGRPVPHQIEPREDPCDGVAGKSDGPIDPRLEPPVGKPPPPRCGCPPPITPWGSDDPRPTDPASPRRPARHPAPRPPPPRASRAERREAK